MSGAGIALIALIGLAILGLVFFFVKELMKPAEDKPAQPEKKKSSLLVILIVIGVVILLCLVGSSFLNTGGLTAGDQYEYRVSGTARSVSVTYFNADGGTEQVESNIPFSKTFSIKNGGAISLLAQNKGDSGSIVCEIYKNGKLWKSATTTAGYGICTLAGFSGLE